MPYDELEALSVNNFGGLNTLENATDLPQFVSPDCQNIEFIPGRFQQRGGTQKVIDTSISANVTYIKSFQLLNGNVRNLFIDALGNFLYEDVTNNPTVSVLIGQNFLPNLYPNSTTLFGKEWLALGDGRQGQDIPRQYDGTNVYRVSQDGPGAPPSVTDFLPAAATIGNPGGGTTVNVSAAPSGEQAVGLALNPYAPPKFISTHILVTTTTAHGFSVGNIVTLVGNTGTTPINGTFTITAVTSTTFQFALTLPNGGSVPVNLGGGGTATVGPPATTTISRTGSVTTAFTIAAHNFQPGWEVQVTGIPNQAVGGAASATQLNGVVTVTTATAHGMVPGATAIIAGMSDTTYNGTFTVVAAPSPTTFIYEQSTTSSSTSGGTVSSPFNGLFTILATPTTTSFTYKDPGPNLTSTSAGTATIQGSVVGGTHQVAVQFLLASGYLTPPSPAGTFVAAGNKLVSLGNIPIGPANTIARYISFTPISSGQFFYIPSGLTGVLPTIINDNTTTGAILNFGDEDLLNGVNINDSFNLLELGEVIGFTEYNSRLVTWGQTNKIFNFNNLSFDGGFSQDSNVCPLGWTPDPTNYSGGGKAAASVTGDAYAITGDGVHTTQGQISQTAFQDSIGDPILSPGIAYTLTFRAQKTNILTGANLTVSLSSVADSYTASGVVNIGTQVSTATFTKFSFNLAAIPSPVPSDLIVQVAATNLSNGDSVYIDCIEFYPTVVPIERSVIRFSGVEDPESFNGLTGFIQPSEENGQAIRNAFIIRDFLYIVKERSLFVTRDDGQNEPAAWEVDEVSSTVGTPSPRGVGVGDEWAVIAAESGLWYFTGGQLTDDNKLSQEIQPTWDSINWNLGHLIDVRVDTIRKRVYINVPLGSTATANNTVLTLDYTEGWGNPQFSQNAVNGMGGGVGRKWCPWTIQTSAINLCLQQNNSFALYCGNSFGNGLIYKLSSLALSDYGNSSVPASFTAIDAYWQSGYFQNSTRLNFSYLIANAVGSGLLNLTLRTGDQVSFYPIRGWMLSSVGLKNMERQIQKQHFRMAVKFEMNAIGSYFMIQGFSVMVKDSIWAPVRGVNF